MTTPLLARQPTFASPAEHQSANAIAIGKIFRPPSLRQRWDATRTKSTASSHRHPTWFDLLYDLVFVSAMAKLGLAFRESGVSAYSIVMFLALFIPIFWQWNHVNQYLNRFDSEDLTQALFFLLTIMATMCLSANIGACMETKNLTEFHCSEFSWWYAGLKLILIVQYARVWFYIDEAKPYVAWLMSFACASCVLWVGTSLTTGSQQLVMWWLSVSADFIIFAGFHRTAWVRRVFIPLNIVLSEERLGGFVIIALGEMINNGLAAGVVDDSSHPETHGSHFHIYASIVLTALIAFDIKMLHFDVGHMGHTPGTTHAMRRHSLAGLVFNVSHIPLLMSLVMVGSVLEKLVTEGGHITVSERWLFCVSLAVSVFVFAFMQLLHLISPTVQRAIGVGMQLLVRSIFATLILCLALFEDLAALAMVALGALLLTLIVVFDVFARFMNARATAQDEKLAAGFEMDYSALKGTDHLHDGLSIPVRRFSIFPASMAETVSQTPTDTTTANEEGDREADLSPMA